MKATIRPYDSRDLGQVLKLWERTIDPALAADGLTVDQAVDLMRSGSAVALVAEIDGAIVGMTVGTTSAALGWVHRLTVLPDHGDGEVSRQLLEHLEPRLSERGARKVATLVREDDVVRDTLERRRYQVSQSLVYLERELPPTPEHPDILSDLGGRMVELGLWDKLKGMEETKQLIERRVILPLAEPDMASRHSVASPKAIVLFGPPGTGKTTFAKAIASHLNWAFVEIQPGELAGEGEERQAKLLAARLEEILTLDSAVVFVDEVEDLASVRQKERKVRPSVTNEFLKQIPRLRDAPHHLLICATNMVGDLDPAFLRHGRFDYILPIGPPDREARAALWQDYVDQISDETVDVVALVDATELFTPADIEFAARKAAHIAFEREHFEGSATRATTEDFLSAIEGTRRTLSEEMVASFRQNTQEFARH